MSVKQVVCPACHKTNRVPDARLTDAPNCGACSSPLFLAKPVELNTSSFSKHITNSDLPVVVDFWASWCGPCKMMAPTFAEVAKELEPKAQFAKLDTEANQQIAAQYHIRSIPTLAIFIRGKEVARQAGAMPAAALQSWLKQYF